MSKLKTAWIGEKRVRESEETNERTFGGVPIIRVCFEDGSIEHFSALMFEKVASKERCSLSDLRDRRCRPVVDVLLTVLREYGVKLSELSYISALLNASMEFNRKAAFSALLSEWMPKPLDPEEADLITIDRILKKCESNKGKEE